MNREWQLNFDSSILCRSSGFYYALNSYSPINITILITTSSSSQKSVEHRQAIFRHRFRWLPLGLVVFLRIAARWYRWGTASPTDDASGWYQWLVQAGNASVMPAWTWCRPTPTGWMDGWMDSRLMAFDGYRWLTVLTNWKPQAISYGVHAAQVWMPLFTFGKRLVWHMGEVGTGGAGEGWLGQRLE